MFMPRPPKPQIVPTYTVAGTKVVVTGRILETRTIAYVKEFTMPEPWMSLAAIRKIVDPQLSQ